MKRKAYLLKTILLLIMICSFVFSCKKDKNDKDESTPTNTNEYLSSDNGTFVNSPIPSESGSSDAKPVIESINGNSTVINGGSNTITILYSDVQNDVKDILVSIKGKTGHYVINKPNTKTSSITFPLLLGTELEDDFIITLCLRDQSGNISSHYELPVTTQTAGTGDLQVSLSWDLLNDIDLHLELPNGSEIYYGDPLGVGEDAEYDFWDWFDINYDIYQQMNMSDEEFLKIYKQYFIDNNVDFTGGELDLDSNPGCYIDEINNENITFSSDATVLNGEYIVRVDFYEDCVWEDSTNYTVTARYKGELINPTSGKNPYISTFKTGTDDYGELGSGIEVMRFNISSTKSFMVATFDFSNSNSKKKNNNFRMKYRKHK